MVTRVQKWGNSLALRIPRSFAAQAKVAAGTAVDIAVEKGRLVVRPVQRRYRLRDLLKAVDTRSLHAEVQTGRPVGREIW
jgi:antitoxin MazE